MKTTSTFLAVLLSLTLPAVAGPLPAATHAAPDVVALAASDGRFAVLAAALKQADLISTLQGEGPFTIFAPTDEAFAALPPGALSKLLEPEQRDALRRILTSHVVAGAVRANDLLRTSKAATVAGVDHPIGLRVGKANVIEADLEASNGIVHVIDRVLLPSLATTKPGTAQPPAAKREPLDVGKTIHAAIDRGVPLFNAGNEDACADVYREAAERLVAAKSLGAIDRMDLEEALTKSAANASERAWTLRRAFDRILANAAFEPRMEASMPPGFPKPGPVGRVVTKRYPRYRAARADGKNSFWTLFRHIKSNKVEMTAPVEMTMDEGMRARDMAFLYERPDQGKTGAQGRVDVLDLEPIRVLSIGMRGSRSETALKRAKAAIEAHMASKGLQRAGDWRVLGYNSPMVSASKRFWELQIPVSR